MRVLTHSDALPLDRSPTCVAIGVFDGVHLGHQSVISAMRQHAHACAARAAVVTFDRHPNSIVAPHRTPPLIQTTSQRLQTLTLLGVDLTWLIRFDEPFSQKTGEQFVHHLIERLGPLRSIHVGQRFLFGYRRSGSVALLEQLGPSLGFTTHASPPVQHDGHPISSTRVREAIQTGHLDAATRMLGRPYRLAGPVVTGDHLATQLGFPTANLDIAGRVVPPTGVYAARAYWLDQTRDAVVNIGRRPTLAPPPGPLRVEAHLLDTSVDLYGQQLELEFLPQARLRDEIRFPSLEHLQEQVRHDIAAARSFFRAH